MRVPSGAELYMRCICVDENERGDSLGIWRGFFIVPWAVKEEVATSRMLYHGLLRCFC